MKIYVFLFILFLLPFRAIHASPPTTDSNVLSLEDCFNYAFQHNPILQQTLMDRQIAEEGIKSRIADWYPQLYFDYSLQHNFQLLSSNIGGNVIQTGVRNTSAGQFSVTQNIFNSDALLASSTAKKIRQQAEQTIVSHKIDLKISVGKAFYDVLLTQEQLKILDEDITRLSLSLKDAFNQYEGGIVDNVDYKRATIALNNAKAQRKTADEILKAKYAYLKMQMGFPDNRELYLQQDSAKLEIMAMADTSVVLNVENRIEYQLLKTQQQLQLANYKYYKWKFLPTVQAFGNYNLNYMNEEFSRLYQANYPNSYAGIAVSVPLFQGMRRIANMRQAKLEWKRTAYNMEDLQSSVHAQYVQAVAIYKSYLNDYFSQKENVVLAQDVYNTIALQYKAGVKTYLEVITAQTDLRTAELNYTNMLYQLLASKLDVERALGIITLP